MYPPVCHDRALAEVPARLEEHLGERHLPHLLPLAGDGALEMKVPLGGPRTRRTERSWASHPTLIGKISAAAVKSLPATPATPHSSADAC